MCWGSIQSFSGGHLYFLSSFLEDCVIKPWSPLVGERPCSQGPCDVTFIFIHMFYFWSSLRFAAKLSWKDGSHKAPYPHPTSRVTAVFHSRHRGLSSVSFEATLTDTLLITARGLWFTLGLPVGVAYPVVLDNAECVDPGCGVMQGSSGGLKSLVSSLPSWASTPLVSALFP